MQAHPLASVEERMTKMKGFWDEIHKKGGVLHVEFASFATNELFKIFEKYAVMNADSLGLNEQELVLLLKHW